MNTQLLDMPIPELRFPEYSEQWLEKTFGDICTFQKGNGISKDDISDEGKYKCIRYGELYTTYSEVIKNIKSSTNVLNAASVKSKIDDLLIPSSGETELDIAKTSCLKLADVLLGGDINILRINENCGEFFAYYLTNYRKKDIAKLAQGNAVVHLYSSHLKSLKVKYPSLSEQQKIASFLSSIDDWIENLRQQKLALEKYKKGMMQKIFTQQIRFEDENGKDFPEWQKLKLGEISTFSRGNGISKADIVENGKYKCIRYGELYTEYQEQIEEVNSRTDIKKSNDALSTENDILMPTSDVTPTGLATASALSEQGVIIGGDILIIRSEKLHNLFFCYYIAANKKDVMRLVNGVTVYHLYGSDLATMKIKLPSLLEQLKITSFLSAIDKLIVAKEKQIKHAELWKKGLMQKLFV